MPWGPTMPDRMTHNRAVCENRSCRTNARKRGELPPVRHVMDDFWDHKIVTASGCWEWTRAHHDAGYGIVVRDGRRERVPRVAWELIHGPIPAGVDVLHHCDNPPCFNPEDLFLGTSVDIAVDMVAKGRASNGSPSEYVQRGDAHWSRRSPGRVPRGDAHWSRRPSNA
jgi:hypothetical protein